ncbi:MAG: hypothetical protein KKE86_15650 [Planctomycetes bacterium]|nr:hypothetical protein [Planctomycetota bacterium]MBU4400751.1 hypothetical protein [Planctomycetota bacterium]MCG2684359.1 hypothetical protein [Planctomycetales bacterium]
MKEFLEHLNLKNIIEGVLGNAISWVIIVVLMAVFAGLLLLPRAFRKWHVRFAALTTLPGAGDVRGFFEFLAGKWRLTWDGPKEGSEVVEIDCHGNYRTGDWRFRIEMLEFIPGKRASFLKHFESQRGRLPERNDLTISEGGRVMSGDGSPPTGLKLRFERLEN